MGLCFKVWDFSSNVLLYYMGHFPHTYIFPSLEAFIRLLLFSLHISRWVYSYEENHHYAKQYNIFGSLSLSLYLSISLSLSLSFFWQSFSIPIIFVWKFRLNVLVSSDIPFIFLKSDPLGLYFLKHMFYTGHTNTWIQTFK